MDAGQLLVEEPRQREASLAAIAGADPLPHGQVDGVQREQAQHRLSGRVGAVLLTLQTQRDRRPSQKTCDRGTKTTEEEEKGATDREGRKKSPLPTKKSGASSPVST